MFVLKQPLKNTTVHQGAVDAWRHVEVFPHRRQAQPAQGLEQGRSATVLDKTETFYSSLEVDLLHWPF